MTNQMHRPLRYAAALLVEAVEASDGGVGRLVKNVQSAEKRV